MPIGQLREETSRYLKVIAIKSFYEISKAWKIIFLNWEVFN